ncbi:glycoside hydrolase [Alteromonas lipolytica]|uniref:Glycoside hydrolase n=1 Tax=Alteromonas lipolytica TaxID=1856405 RepID=A0A1E8F8U4_9ALTE|nr:glycoside hydrolase [Alteromonas lipolytica]
MVLLGCSGNQTEHIAKDEPVRSVKLLADNWQFMLSDTLPEGVLSPGVNADDWQSVSVPHSWNRVGYYQNSDSDHLHTPDNINTTMGAGYYRLSFTLDKASAGLQHWLEFDAASRTAEVWLNGVRLGEHRGGFNRFRFNATAAINENQANLLVVKVDNSKPTATSTTFDTLPIAGDFFVHGGLYRPVRLVSTPDVHVAMDDFGGPGVYATTTLTPAGTAEVNVNTLISSLAETPQQVLLTTRLVDAAGNVAAQQQIPLSLQPAKRTEQSITLAIPSPHLWHGVSDPYLYKLEAVLTDSEGNWLDTVSQPYGLRTIGVDADKGFILNGKPLTLKGVAYHQDREGRGWAVSPEDIAEDVKLLVDMGANTIRLAHYPHGQPVHKLANEQGIILWDEIPLVSVWRYAEEYEAANQALLENAQLQLTEMIKQNFNHPSVAVWGIANEVDFGAVLPAFLGSPPDSEPDPTPVLTVLDKQVAELDPSRYSTLANCCEANARWPADKVPKTTGLSQTTGLNRYYGWYYGKPQDLDEHLDTLHGLYPQQPISVSEYGAGGATSMHSDNVFGGPVAATGRHQPEEYMSYVHEANWAILASKPYLWATWIWNAFDFATTTRVEGDSIDINTKGVITYDRAINKDSYYFYQANWSDKPMVHITSKRYVERAYQVTAVKVYSNLTEVELLVNGESQGVQSNCIMATCEWPDVRLTGGENTIIARGVGDREGVSDTANWRLNAPQVNAYHIDTGAIMASDTAPAQYGSDAFFSGGSAKSLDKPGGWGRPPKPADIKDVSDQPMATTYRSGEFSYALPLDEGKYKVSLLVVAQAQAAEFMVTANNAKPVAIKTPAGSEDAGYASQRVEFDVEVTNGRLQLAFTPGSGPAAVSAISVTPL